MADKLRIGVLSTARIGLGRFIPGVKAASRQTEVVAIASREQAKAEAAAREAGVPRAHGSYEALLSDTDVDAIYISLPNSLHHEWTIRCAEAGKHVLCEKPVARSAKLAAEMAEACRKAGVVYMEAFMYRHHPRQAKVRELLTQDVIGEPRLIRASFCFYMRYPEGNIRVNAGLQGGSLMDVGCYTVDVARMCFGEEPSEVTAFQRIVPKYGVDMTFAGLLRFPGKRLAVLDSSFEVGSGGRYEVAGDRGSLVVENAFTPGDAPTTIRINAAPDQRTIDIPGIDQYGLEADHFAQSVRAGALLAPAEDGVANSRVVEALYRSAEEGRAVRLG